MTIFIVLRSALLLAGTMVLTAAVPANAVVVMQDSAFVAPSLGKPRPAHIQRVQPSLVETVGTAENASILLLGLGIVGLLSRRRRGGVTD